MEAQIIKITELPDLLSMRSRLDLTDLAKEIGISRATLNNWKRGIVNKINYQAREKLARALDKHKWGFRIQKYSGTELEIIYFNDKPKVNLEIPLLRKKVVELQELNETLTRKYFEKDNENLILQEKLSKYESRK